MTDRLTDIMFEQMLVAKLNGNLMCLLARDMFCSELTLLEYRVTK